MRKILLSFLVAAWTFTPIGASAQTINNLGAGTTVTGSDLYPSYQGSNPAVSVTATQLQTFMGTVVQTGPGATGGTCNPGATCTIQTQEIPVTVTSGNITTAISGGLYGELINYNSASDQTPTIPVAATAGNGTFFELCGIQHSQTVTHSSSDTIGGASTYLLPTGTEAAPSCVGLRSDGVSNWNPIPYGGSSGGSGNALFGTTTGNTSGDLVSMSNTTVGVQDSGIGTSGGKITAGGLPVATTGAQGIMQVGSGLSVSVGVVSNPYPIAPSYYLSGNWYVGFGYSYVAVGSAGTGSFIYCSFSGVTAAVTIKSLGVNLTSGNATGNVQIAVYSQSGGTLTLVDKTSSISTASTGYLNASVGNTTDTLLPGGLYAWCVNTSINSVVYETQNQPASLIAAEQIGSPTQSQVQSTTTVLGLQISQTFGTWPSTISISSMSSVTAADVPSVSFQVN